MKESKENERLKDLRSPAANKDFDLVNFIRSKYKSLKNTRKNLA